MVAVNSRKLYLVDAINENKWWVLQARLLPNAISQVKSLDLAESWIREAISMVSGEPEDSFDVEIIPVVGDELESALQEAREFAAELDSYQRRMARLSRSVAGRLSDLNISGKDIATIMKISPQRVSQLLKGKQ